MSRADGPWLVQRCVAFPLGVIRCGYTIDSARPSLADYEDTFSLRLFAEICDRKRQPSHRWE